MATAEDVQKFINEVVERSQLTSNKEDYANNSALPYTSCIVFKGKPILPPLMTPERRCEMAHYKELAINLEKRHRQRHLECEAVKTVNTNIRNGNEKQISETIFNGHFENETSAMSNLSRTMISCTPSVASTDLAKYMNATCDNDDLIDIQDSSLLTTLYDGDSGDDLIVRNKSERNLEEVFFEESPLLAESNDFQEDNVAYPQIRKLSYTLETPSPALLASLKRNSTICESSIVSTGDEPKRLSLSDGEDINLAINDNSKTQDVLHEAENIDSISQLESPNLDSLFSNLYIQHRNELGIKCENLHVEYQNKLDDLIKQHDEALEKLKKNFIETAIKLVLNNQVRTDNSTDSLIPIPKVPEQTLLNNDRSISNSQIDSSVPENLQIVQSITQKISSAKILPNYDRVSAAVRGYLTRRLFKTQKVQTIIKTIKDTLEFAFELHSDSPLSDGCVTPQDAELHERLIAQLSSACYEIHDVFFKTTIKERMSIIAQDRALLQEKYIREISLSNLSENQNAQRKLSSATIKAIDRRRRSDSRSSSSPRAWRVFKIRSPRENPVFSGKYRRNFESDLRSYSTSLLTSPKSFSRIEHRSFSASSETDPSIQHVRRTLDYGRQPFVRKIKIKKHLDLKPFYV